MCLSEMGAVKTPSFDSGIGRGGGGGGGGGGGNGWRGMGRVEWVGVNQRR